MDYDSDDEIRQTTSYAGVTRAWPKYLVLEPLDEAKPLSVFLVFAIDTATRGISSSLEVKNKQRDGSILIYCKTEKASRQLRAWDGKIFVERPVSVSVHRRLNSCM